MPTWLVLFQGVNLQRAVDEANSLLAKAGANGGEVVSVHLDRTLAVAGPPEVHQWHVLLAI
jgi:hypothetical protein